MGLKRLLLIGGMLIMLLVVFLVAATVLPNREENFGCSSDPRINCAPG
jgi:hypothetical protein